MKTTSFAGIDTAISRIVQGSLGLIWGTDAEAFAVLDAAVESGITAFDTAHIYDFDDRGVDRLLGRWLSGRGDRDQLVLMAKGCHPDHEGNARVVPAAISDDISDTLERSGLERLDLWSFHRDDPGVPIGELVDAVNAEVASGRISAWGVSNWTTGRIRDALDYAAKEARVGPVANSAHYSLAAQLAPPWDDVVTLTGRDAEPDRQWHRDVGLPVVAWSSLAGGFLSANVTRSDLEQPDDDHFAEVARCYANVENWARRDRAATVADERGVSLSQVAVAWVLGDDMSTLAITGGATIDEVRQNAAAAEIELTRDERRAILEGPA